MAAQACADVLRDVIVCKYLEQHCKTAKFHKPTDGPALHKQLVELFNAADLPLQSCAYTADADTLYERVKHVVSDNKGNFKAKVKTSYAAMELLVQLCGFNATTVEDVFSAIGTIKRNARVAAATASVAAVASTVATVTEDATVRMAPSPLAPVLEAPLVLESAMTASAPADILVTVVETTQPAKSHRKNIPMCANNTRITSFFGAAPPSAEPLSQSSSQPSANRQPSSNPVGVQKPKSKMKILHAKILRAGDYTKLKNSVAQLRRDARTFSATKAEHDREMDTLKKELLFARRGVISEYSATTMQRTHAVLATSLVAATRRSTMLKETLARNFAPDVRKIWAGRGGKLNPEFAGACLNLVYECGISVEKLSLAILYVFGALFPGTAFSGRLPSPATWRNALLDLGARDASVLADAINNNPNPIHLATDSSQRKLLGKSTFHVIYGAQWSNEEQKPVSASQFLVPFGVSQTFAWQVRRLIAVPIVTGGGAKLTATDTFDAIQAAGVDLSKKRPFNPAIASDAANGALAEGRALADCIGVTCLLLSCFMHCLSKMAENGFVRAFGDRGDMATRNLLQFTFTGYWLFDAGWDYYKSAWRTFFHGRGATEDVMALTKPQKPILTRWGYITLHLLWLCGRWNEIKLFAAHMADIITDGHKQIWIQYRAFFENVELELEAHLALEWGLKFINPEMAWTAEGDAEFNLPPGFKAARMPLHIAQLKSKLAKMSALAGASGSSANLIKTVFPNAFTRLVELNLQPAALEVEQKLLGSKAEAFISAAIDTLKNNGEDRWMSEDFMWGCLTERSLQAYFARWLYANVLSVETDSFNFTAVLLPGVDSEVLEKMQSVYWTDGLAAQMREQWQRWLAAGDLGYAPYAVFISDLQKMAMART
jgi:hypothetical protein